MRRSHWFFIGVLVTTFLALEELPSLAQQRPSPGTMPPMVSGETPSPLQQTLRRKFLKASYKQLQDEVGQLMDLATKLQEEVDKANEDTLSLGVVKKAEEIEKLAGKIKNRMKNL